MKTRQWLYFAAFICVIACSSCNKNKLDSAKYIPKDVNFVLGIQPEALRNKLKDHKDLMDSITQFFEEKMSGFTSSDSGKQAAAALINSVDTKQPVFVFVQTKSSIVQGNAMLAGCVVALSDANKFADYIKPNLQGNVSQGNGYSFGMLKDGGDKIVGWNKTTAILVFVSDDLSSAPAQLENLFNLKESESLADNNSFSSSYDAQADMSFYINSQTPIASSVLAMTKASDLVKDTYVAGSVTFNDGSVDMQLKSYHNATLQNLISKNPSESLDGKTLNNYPGKLQGMIDFSINPKFLVSVLQYMGIDQMIDQYLQKEGLTMDDIAALFKGEFAAGMSNFSKGHTPNFLVCAPLTGKAAYDKVVNALAKNNPDVFINKNGLLVPNMSQSPFGFSADNNNLIFASSQGMIDSFATGKGQVALPDDAAKNLKGKIAYIYGDLQSILGGIPTNDNSKDSETIVIVNRTLKDFSAWGNAPSGKVYTGEAHVRFMDGKQNSLVSILTMIRDEQRIQEKYDLINGILQKSDSTAIQIAPPAEQHD